MTVKTAPLITPGLDDTRAAYESIRALGVDPHHAADWLAAHVRTVTRDDIEAQIMRNHARPAVKEISDPAAVAITRALQTAVKVYNASRPRLTIVDKTATVSGAAAVNRAAVLRQMHTPGEGPAFLGRYNPQWVGRQRIGRYENGSGRYGYAIEVSGRLHISGGAVRAYTSRFVLGNGLGEPSIDDFRVILPGTVTH